MEAPRTHALLTGSRHVRNYNSQKTMPKKKNCGGGGGKWLEGSRENEVEAAARSGWRGVERVRRKRRRCRPTIPGGRAGRRFVSGL